MTQRHRPGPVRRGSGQMLAGLLLLATGCAGHVPPQAVAPPVPVPKRFSRAGEAPLPARWWQAFGSEELNRLVHRALAANPGLQQRLARIREAEAAARVAGAPRWPSLDAAGSAAHITTRAPTVPAAGGTARGGAGGGTAGATTGEDPDLADLPRTTTETRRLEGSLSLAYEVDLWGRVRATHDAARLLVQVSREEYDAASIMLAGQVTETWLGLLEQKARRRLLTRQIQTLQRYLEMVELRFAHGQSVATDVYAQRRQLAAAEAQIPRLEARREALAHRLAVLLGRPPLALPPLETAALPAPPPIPAGGVPGDLLQRRPDVRAAYYRVQEIDRRVAAAIADRFPALRLTGRLSDQASESANLFQDWVLNLAGNLTAPLLDGGRRRAEVQRQRARLAARLQAYGETILTAVREVEDALSAERRQRQHLARLERQLAATRGTLTVARRRYSDGVGDYLRVLTALERVQQLEQSLLTQRAQLLVDRLTLYKALAGPYRSRPRPVAQILIAQPTTESLPGGLP